MTGDTSTISLLEGDFAQRSEIPSHTTGQTDNRDSHTQTHESEQQHNNNNKKRGGKGERERLFYLPRYEFRFKLWLDSTKRKGEKIDPTWRRDGIVILVLVRHSRSARQKAGFWGWGFQRWHTYTHHHSNTTPTQIPTENSRTGRRKRGGGRGWVSRVEFGTGVVVSWEVLTNSLATSSHFISTPFPILLAIFRVSIATLEFWSSLQ